VLLPRKRPDKEIVERFKNKLILSWSGTVWMNDEVTEEYLTKIFGPGVFQKRLGFFSFTYFDKNKRSIEMNDDEIANDSDNSIEIEF
jgi:hypothetical protein